MSARRGSRYVALLSFSILVGLQSTAQASNPTPHFRASDTRPGVGETVTFASTSTRGEGDIFCIGQDVASEEWDLDGNGTFEHFFWGSGSQVSHTYNQANKAVKVTLRIANSCGDTFTAYDYLVVENPTVNTADNQVDNSEDGSAIDDLTDVKPLEPPTPGLPVPGCEDEHSDPRVCALRRYATPPIDAAQLADASTAAITAVAVDTKAAPGYHHYIFCRFGLGASVFFLSPAASKPWFYKGGTFLDGCIEVEYIEGVRYTSGTTVNLSTFARIGREKPEEKYPEACFNRRKDYLNVRYKEHNAGCTFKSRRSTRIFGQMDLTPTDSDLKWLPEEAGVETVRGVYFNCTLLNGRRTLDCFMNRYIK